MKSLAVVATTLAGVLVLAGCSGGSDEDSAGGSSSPAPAGTTPAEPVKADVWERPATYTASGATVEGWQAYEFYDQHITLQAPAGWTAEQSELSATMTAPDGAASITILYVPASKAASFGGRAPAATEEAAKKSLDIYTTSAVVPALVRGAATGFYLTADDSTLTDGDDSHVAGLLFQLPDTGEQITGLVQISQDEPIESETLNAILASVVVK